jgi:hypothetical protein
MFSAEEGQRSEFILPIDHPRELWTETYFRFNTGSRALEKLYNIRFRHCHACMNVRGMNSILQGGHEQVDLTAWGQGPRVLVRVVKIIGSSIDASYTILPPNHEWKHRKFDFNGFHTRIRYKSSGCEWWGWSIGWWTNHGSNISQTECLFYFSTDQICFSTEEAAHLFSPRTADAKFEQKPAVEFPQKVVQRRLPTLP